MILSHHSERNPIILIHSSVLYLVISFNIRYRACIVQMLRNPRSPSMVLPGCILSTVMHESCERRSMVLMLTKK
jgi:hypothetical protein